MRDDDPADVQAELQLDAAPACADVDLAAARRAWEVRPGDLARSWLNAERKTDYRARSMEQYLLMVNRVSTWLAHERSNGARVCTLLCADRADVDAFLSQPRSQVDQAKRLSPTSVSRYAFLLSKLFDHLVSEGLRATNPIASMLREPSIVQPQRAAPSFLRASQFDAYLAWVVSQPLQSWTDVRDRALRLIFAASGITVEEARALNVHDVSLRDLGPGDRPGLDVASHARTPARRAPLAGFASEPLRAWLERRDVEAARLGLTAGEGALFPAALSGPGRGAVARVLGAAEIYAIVRPAMEASGNTDAQRGPQALRNTFIARQMAANVTDAQIRAWTGLATNFTIEALRRQMSDAVPV